MVGLMLATKEVKMKKEIRELAQELLASARENQRHSDQATDNDMEAGFYWGLSVARWTIARKLNQILLREEKSNV